MKIYFCEQILKKLGWEKSIVLGVTGVKNFKRLEHHIFAIKHYFFLVFVRNVELKMEKYLREKNQLKYQKLLVYLL